MGGPICAPSQGRGPPRTCTHTLHLCTLYLHMCERGGVRGNSGGAQGVPRHCFLLRFSRICCCCGRYGTTKASGGSSAVPSSPIRPIRT